MSLEAAQEQKSPAICTRWLMQRGLNLMGHRAHRVHIGEGRISNRWGMVVERPDRSTLKAYQ